MEEFKLKLYVWDEFAPDFKNGLAFAIAPTVQEAQELIEEKLGRAMNDCGRCQEFELNEPIGFFCTGGS